MAAPSDTQYLSDIITDSETDTDPDIDDYEAEEGPVSSTATTTPDTELPPLPSSFDPLAQSSFYERLSGPPLGVDPLDVLLPSTHPPSVPGHRYAADLLPGTDAISAPEYRSFQALLSGHAAPPSPHDPPSVSGHRQLNSWDGQPQANNSLLATLPGQGMTMPMTDPSMLPNALGQLSATPHGGMLTRQSSMGQALSGFMRTGLQQPMSRAMTAVSEGSMAALQAPVTLALASARMGSGVIMGAVEGATDGAKRAWRRKNQSDESKEKERARNRRAQRRFREKQKERLAARKDSLKELAATLQSVSQEKEKVEQRNAVLEKIVTMQIPPEPSVPAPEAEMSSTFEFGDLYAGEDAPKRMRITLSTGPLDLQLADLKALTWEQHVHIWKDQMQQIHQQLQLPECQGEGVTDRLLELVGEACGMSQCLCAVNPTAMLRLQSHRLDLPADAAPETAPAAFWDTVLDKMAPSEQVMAEALAHRRAHLQQLGSLLRRRIEVNQYTVGTLGRSDTTQGSASSHASKLLQAIEASKKLQASLREEQSLLVQRMVVMQQRLLSPRQMAVQLTASYPFYPDVVALIESVARKFPNETNTEELLGLQLPPSSKNLLKTEAM